MELSSSELIVLGLVVETPRHGYDLERVIEHRGIRRWTDIGFSSIYYLLTRLEQRGLVHTPAAASGAKSKRVFHPTGAGREAATRAAFEFIADPGRPLLVGVSNLALLPPGEYRRALGERLAGIEARIETVRAAETAQAPLPEPARHVFSYSLTLLEAERNWLARAHQN